MSRQSNVVVNSAVQRIQAAAMRLKNSKFGQIAVDTFRSNMLGQLKRDSHILAQMGWNEGKGPRGEFSFDIADTYIDEQITFLNNWIDEISKAKALPGGVGRAALYGESLGQVYQRYYVAARGAEVGLPDLPAYPRDGSTVCRVRCRCQWKIVKRAADLFEATWKLGEAEHCQDCIERSKTWNPLRLIWMPGDEKWEMFVPSTPGKFVPMQ